MTADEKPVTGQFSVTPVLSAQSLKGACLALGAGAALVFLVVTLREPFVAANWGISIFLFVLTIQLGLASFYLGLAGSKAMQTMFTVDEESIRLFNGQVELGQMRREDIHSIVWSQAPTEWINLTQLELKDREGVTRLALPIPYQFSPLQKHPGELNSLLSRENRQWQSFVDQIRKQFEGREQLEADFDISLSRFRFMRIRSQVGFVVATLAMLGIHVYLLILMGVLPENEAFKRGLSVLFPLVNLANIDWITLEAFGSRLWISNRKSEWMKDSEPGQPPRAPGRYRYPYRALLANDFMRQSAFRRFIFWPLGIIGLVIVVSGFVIFFRTGLWAVLPESTVLGGVMIWSGKCVYKAEKHAGLKHQNVDDLLEFREDGSLVVTRPTGETMTLTTTDGPFLKRRREYGVYTDGSTEYIVYPGLLDPDASESPVGEDLATSSSFRVPPGGGSWAKPSGGEAVGPGGTNFLK